MLHRRGVECRTEFAEPGLARLAVIPQYPDLNQFMRRKRHSGFPDYRFGQSLRAYHHHRLERVGKAFQMFTLFDS